MRVGLFAFLRNVLRTPYKHVYRVSIRQMACTYYGANIRRRYNIRTYIAVTYFALLVSTEKIDNILSPETVILTYVSENVPYYVGITSVMCGINVHTAYQNTSSHVCAQPCPTLYLTNSMARMGLIWATPYMTTIPCKSSTWPTGSPWLPTRVIY